MSSLSATSSELKSRNGHANIDGSCKNVCHMSRSTVSSPETLTWWCGFKTVILVYEYILRVNSHPRTITCPRKLRNPTSFWRSCTVTFLFFLDRICSICSCPAKIFSFGSNTSCLTVSISSPKKTRVVYSHTVFSITIGKLILLHNSMNRSICWSQIILSNAIKSHQGN